MLDWILATIGVPGVVAFMGIVTVFAMEPDLWIVSTLVLGITIMFAWRDLRGAKPADSGDSEG